MSRRHTKKRGEPASPMMIAALVLTLLFATGVLFLRLANESGAENSTEAETVAEVVEGVDVVEVAETEAPEVVPEPVEELTDIEKWTLEIEDDPDDYHNYYRRGQAYYRVYDYEQAVRDLTQSIELNPEHEYSYLYRCYAQNDLGNYEAALHNCEKTIELDPDIASAYNSKGLALYFMEDDWGALEAYSQALAIKPGYTYALNNRGLVHLQQKNYSMAIADFTASIENRNDEVHKPLVSRGDVYEEMGQYDLALLDYDRAIEDNPDYTRAYLHRGLLHDRMGNHDDAVSDYYAWIIQTGTARDTYETLTIDTPKTLTMKEGRLYNLNYVGKAGDTITITATGYDNGVDPIMVLTYSDKVLEGNDDRVLDEDFDAEISHITLPYSGNYFVKLSHAGGGSEGDVTVLVTLDSAAGE